MIPYDDLVAALSSWRARQGLPVSTVGAAPSGPAPVATTTPGSGPRTAPPAAPQMRTNPPAPPRAAPIEEPLDVEDAAMLDEQAYEPEGSDFAMSFAAGGNDESTTIGSAPEPPPSAPARKPNRNDDW